MPALRACLLGLLALLLVPGLAPAEPLPIPDVPDAPSGDRWRGSITYVAEYAGEDSSSRRSARLVTTGPPTSSTPDAENYPAAGGVDDLTVFVRRGTTCDVTTRTAGGGQLVAPTIVIGRISVLQKELEIAFPSVDIVADYPLTTTVSGCSEPTTYDFRGALGAIADDNTLPRLPIAADGSFRYAPSSIPYVFAGRLTTKDGLDVFAGSATSTSPADPAGGLAGGGEVMEWSFTCPVNRCVFRGGALPKPCDDGADNDGDGLIDRIDPGCTSATDSSELGTVECDDGRDNDGDGLLDALDRLGCSSSLDDDERDGLVHYHVEAKAWIPFAHVVDPKRPLVIRATTAFALGDRPCFDPGALFWAVGGAKSTYRGDTHRAYDGSYRARVSADFDWDGTTVSGLRGGSRFGATHRDTVWDGPGFAARACLSAQRTAKGDASFEAAADGGVRLTIAAKNPLVSPAPAIDSVWTYTVDPAGTLHVAYATDRFPAHGTLVTRDGVRQLTANVNDLGCLPPDAVLGPRADALLGAGLTTVPGLPPANGGEFTVAPTERGRVEARPGFLCDHGLWDVTVDGGNSIPIPGFSAGARAGSGTEILIREQGTTWSLADAEARGLVGSSDADGRTHVFVDAGATVEVIANDAARVSVVGLGPRGKVVASATYAPGAATVALAPGAKPVATRGARVLRPVAPDRIAPRTTIRREARPGGRSLYRLTAADRASKPVVIWLVTEGARPRPYRKPLLLTLAAARRTLVFAVDAAGNREGRRRLAR